MNLFEKVAKPIKTGKKSFDIFECIKELKSKRPIFVSEADFQVELSWIIIKNYPDAKVRCEYIPSFDPDMHIDILVIKDDKWIPIELKYKTKGCVKNLGGESFNLKNQGAKDIGCYLYLNDIQRIERIKMNVPSFAKGYTILLTNEQSYMKKPRKESCYYREFALTEGEIKKGILNWADNTGTGTKKGIDEPILLLGEYPIHWEKYSSVDNSNSGTFWYLVNTVN